MPRGDGTGPAGMAPMTGRAAGFCDGYSVPGYMNSTGRGLGGGFGRGGGRGFGRGMAMGRGIGRNFAQIPAAMPQPAQTRQQELAMLKQQTEVLGEQMQQIQERIGQLESEEEG